MADPLLSSNFQYKFTLRSAVAAIEWFKQEIKDLKNPKAATKKDLNKLKEQLLNSDAFKTDTFEVGKMYLYHYDPKHRDTLPYYDTFPLIFLLKRTKTGFTGLNLHYLPVEQRMVFISNLMQKSVFDSSGKLDRLNIRYENLKYVQEFQFFQPCFKQYLFSNIKSSIKLIPPEDWGFAAALPIETFLKATKQQVWKDSMQTQGMTL